jgi:integrase
VILVAMYTGFRGCEIKSLRWRQVDMVRKSITVLATNAKNKDEKCLPMNETLYQLFVRLKSERDRGPEDFVFVSRYGKPWKSWRTAFENTCATAGVSNFRFHDLRHSFASWLAMRGVNQKGLMQLLGHRDPKMTLRYTHLSSEYQRAAVESLAAFTDENLPPSKKSFEKSCTEERPVLVAIAK